MSDLEKINTFAADYGHAFQSGDVDAIKALITDDFVAMTPDKPPIEGREAVAAEIESDLQSMKVQRLRFTHDEVVVTGQWAYARGRSHAQLEVAGDVMEIHGKYLWILKQCEGVWRLARDSASGNGK